MTLRLALLPDFPEEGWPSMDLCHEQLARHLPTRGPWAIQAETLQPTFRRRFQRLPRLGRRGVAFNADRIYNRFLVYPRFVRRFHDEFAAFHVVDHTYAQLVLALPAARTGVYCHDLDAFRCLLEPAAEPRPRWFRAMARRILAGLQQAAVVFHSTGPIREAILRHGLIPAEKLIWAPYGVAEEFTAEPDEANVAPSWLPATTSAPWLLHVGSCIPRKRIDRLLTILAGVRECIPGVQLVKVGGDWSPEQRQQIDTLHLGDAIIHVTGVSRRELAWAYRRARLVLLPSEAEGFGLPIIEALACGADVLASDLPVLREVGGTAAMFLPGDDPQAWIETVTQKLKFPGEATARQVRQSWAARFSWTAHAETIAAAYHRLRGAA